MRAPDPLDGLIRLIRSYIRIERKTRFKRIPVDVVPTIARDHHTRVLPTTAVNIFETARNRWENREISRSDDCTMNSFGA